MGKKRILFVCIHNSARSQMAEAFVNYLAGDRFEAESAGIEPGTINPIVVDAMKEIGIDISHHTTDSLQDVINEKREYDYIITVCDQASAEKCPIVPSLGRHLHVGFPDLSVLEGNYATKLMHTREIRNQIKSQVQERIKIL